MGLFKSKAEKELGYLSFKDDRLLFGLIPLFERREAQVRMKIRKCEKKAKSADVDLWIRSVESDNTAVESINLNSTTCSVHGYHSIHRTDRGMHPYPHLMRAPFQALFAMSRI